MLEEDLRETLFNELVTELKEKGIRAIIRIGYPENGATIKLKGIVLYKILKVENPFKNKGIVVYRHMANSDLEKIKGRRASGKNNWTCAPLYPENYHAIKNILVKIATSFNTARNSQFNKKRKEIKVQPKTKRR